MGETNRRPIERPAPDAYRIFAKHADEIRRIMRRHGIRNLNAFGSRARGDAQPGDDLDLVAEMNKGGNPLAILTAEADLEEELGMRVHLVELPKTELRDIIKQEGTRFAG